MPEVWFRVKWPDGTSSDCYSPSTVVERYFTEGQCLTLRAFLDAARPALEEASQRVEAKYGYRCTSADEQLRSIEETAERIGVEAPGEVTIVYLGRSPP